MESFAEPPKQTRRAVARTWHTVRNLSRSLDCSVRHFASAVAQAASRECIHSTCYCRNPAASLSGSELRSRAQALPSASSALGASGSEQIALSAALVADPQSIAKAKAGCANKIHAVESP
jgi:hypothetical protein